jgi:hypothetical protein
MPTFLRKLVVTCSWVCMACVAQAQTDADTATALVRSSGMWTQSELIAPQVRSGFLRGLTSGKARISKTEVERVVRTIDRVYAPERFQVGLVASLQSGIQAEHVVNLRNWFASDLGRAIVRLEASSEAAGNPQEMVQQGMAILKAQSAERRALHDELVSASRAVDTMTQMTIDTSMAVINGIRSVRPDGSGPAPSAIRAELEKQRTQMQAMFNGMAHAMFARIYADLPTQDLAQYVSFLQSAAGQHFTEVGRRAFMDAMRDASTEFGRLMPSTSDQSNT